MTIDQILEKLKGVTPNGVKKWTARCPAHSDSTASLSLRVKDDGFVLLHCFANCKRADIIKALGLTERDLGAELKLLATYQYKDTDGTLLYERLRYAPKTF